MSEGADSSSQTERLAEARRRLYMPEASEADLAAVIALETIMADSSKIPTSAVEADDEHQPANLSSRSARGRTTLLLGGTAVVLFVLATALVLAQARTERRQEAHQSVSTVASMSLRQLLTQFSSTLPSEWQGAPIVAARAQLHGTVSLPVSTSAATRQHFLVIRCRTVVGRWSVQAHSAKRAQPDLAIGSCGELGFVPLPIGTDSVQILVANGQAYSIVVMAHS